MPTGVGTSTAVSAITAMDRTAGGVEFVEQPCRTLEEVARCGASMSGLRWISPSGRR